MCVGLLYSFVVLLPYVINSFYFYGSASDWPERLVSEITYNVLMGTLNPTHSLIQLLVIADLCTLVSTPVRSYLLSMYSLFCLCCILTAFGGTGVRARADVRLGDPPPTWIQEPLAVIDRDGRPQEDPWQCTASVCVVGVYCWGSPWGKQIHGTWSSVCPSYQFIVGFCCMYSLCIVSY